jgi:excisionase family DNA binding protein
MNNEAGNNSSVTAKLKSLPEVLTVPELMALLRISRNTAYEGLRSGQIPGAVRVGKAIRVSKDAVLRWLDQGRV